MILITYIVYRLFFAVSQNIGKKICLVGEFAQKHVLRDAAQRFGVPVVTSIDGLVYTKKKNCFIVFVVDNFDDNPVYKSLCRTLSSDRDRHSILGPTALIQLSLKDQNLPHKTRPLYNNAMSGVIVCFRGFSEIQRDNLTRLILLVRHMGASIRKAMSTQVTHLIANLSGGDKYQYAITFQIPVVHSSWVYDSWEHRNEIDFRATQDDFVTKHRMKPFYDIKVWFLGFSEVELTDMTKALIRNGGSVRRLNDPFCTHVVVEEGAIFPSNLTPKIHIVNAQWFWTSVQKEARIDEKEYLFTKLPEPVIYSSTAKRRKKKLQETLQSLALQPSPVIHKSDNVNDSGLSSVSNSFDCTDSSDKNVAIDELSKASAVVTETLNGLVIETPRKAVTARQQVFLELVQTESNYVNILQTIMTMFKRHLENMPEEKALLDNTEIKIIFGNLPLIYETHFGMLDELRSIYANWTEDHSIGNIILKYSEYLLKAYPPYINFFEEKKKMLVKCDENKPRFHAFLKACQTRPECGRQTLQDLLIRPVQRLPSISLLLNDMLKNTSQLNADHSALSQALSALKEVMTHINEGKRRTEGQKAIFDIFNEIDNCPPDLVSSHRSFVTRTEVVQLSSESLSSKGNFCVLFLFNDQLEVCKRRSKADLKTPNTVNGVHLRSATKPYIHINLIPLSSIKRVIDIKETEECQKVFSLVIRNNDDIKERLYSFAMAEEDIDKTVFLRTLCKQMATNACTTDSHKFLAFLEPDDLDIDTSDSAFSKAFKLANLIRLKIGRTFSFSRTPSTRKRTVSLMSSFDNTQNITPAQQVAQMRPATYSNSNELSNNNEHLSVAPRSSDF